MKRLLMPCIILVGILSGLYFGLLQHIVFGKTGVERLSQRAVDRENPSICSKIIVLEDKMIIVPLPIHVTTTREARSLCYQRYVSEHPGQDVCPADDWSCIMEYAITSNKPQRCLTAPATTMYSEDKYAAATSCLLGVANRSHSLSACDILDPLNKADADFCRSHYKPD